jgi:tetratricopeptide (TPR) repeat protein
MPARQGTLPLRRLPRATLYYVFGILVVTSVGSRILSSVYSNIGHVAWQAQTVANGLPSSRSTDRNVADHWSGWWTAALTISRVDKSALRGIGLSSIKDTSYESGVTALQQGEFNVYLALAQGRRSLAQGDYTGGVQWFLISTRLAPKSRDAWYYLGMAYEKLELWDYAIGAHKKAASLEGSFQIGRSSPLYRLGVLYESVLTPPNLKLAKEYYLAAVEQHSFATTSEEAYTRCQLGYVYSGLDHDWQHALIELGNGLRLAPNHYWCRLHYGVGLYYAKGDLTAAVDQIQQAIAAWPQDRSRQWPYRYLGSIYSDEGLPTAAARAYKQALSFDPSNGELQALVSEDWK